MKKLITSLTVLIFLALSLNSQVVVLSGLENGTYDQLTNDIKGVTTVSMEIRTSKGSVDNFEQLNKDNEVNIAFMQYDVLLANEMIDAKIKDHMRILIPLFLDEEIHLITKQSSEIKKITDLEMKKVGIGTTDQGTHITAKTIKNKTGINWEDVEISSNEAYDALMAGKIDAYFYVGGVPINELKDKKDIKLVSVKHKSLKDIYVKKKIDVEAYPWMEKKVITIAVPTLFVLNNSKIDDNFKKEVEKLYFDIKDNVTKLQADGHPKWKDVYYKNTEINWPYYYIPEKKRTSR
jgi:TRAP transporter TAXI family solute receptor